MHRTVAAVACVGALCAPGCRFDSGGTAAGDGGAAPDARPPDDAADTAPDAPPPPPPLADGDARVVYAVGASNKLQNQRFANAAEAWFAEPALGPFGGRVPWIVHRIDPSGTGAEKTMTVAQTASGLATGVASYAGGQWAADWAVVHGLGVSSATRGFDLEFEASGDALAVYGVGTSTPAYRVWTAGQWSAERRLPVNDGGGGPLPDINRGAVRWVELEPRPDSDEIALVYADDRDELAVIVWTGDDWDLATAVRLEDRLKVNPQSRIVHNRAFDVAFESLSGDVLVAWGREGAGGFFYRVWDATHRFWSPELTLGTVPLGTPHFVDLASDPASDLIALGLYDLGDGIERLGVAMWTGASLVDAVEIDSQIADVDDTAQGDFPGELAFLPAAGVAVAVYPDDASGELGYATWSPVDLGWTAGSVPLSAIGRPRSFDLAVLPGGAVALVVASDDEGRLFAARFDGQTWAPDAGGAPIASGLLDGPFTPFSLDVRLR
ncbi:MAG: hypothetical protein D6689_17580 [Deltaproteobacteria bacterium]|nr:MAG: hypothetical protein D6689_17580 [Deltaproteobacteria bacterium]